MDPEQAAVHAALWGSVEQFDALAPDIDLDQFHDPWSRAVLAAMLDLWRRGFEPSVAATHMQMVSDGTARDTNEDVIKLYLLGVDRAGGRLEGLAHYLHQMRQDHERRHLRDLLVSLAATLEHADGPERVRRRLREVA